MLKYAASESGKPVHFEDVCHSKREQNHVKAESDREEIGYEQSGLLVGTGGRKLRKKMSSGIKNKLALDLRLV